MLEWALHLKINQVFLELIVTKPSLWISQCMKGQLMKRKISVVAVAALCSVAACKHTSSEALNESTVEETGDSFSSENFKAALNAVKTMTMFESPITLSDQGISGRDLSILRQDVKRDLLNSVSNEKSTTGYIVPRDKVIDIENPEDPRVILVQVDHLLTPFYLPMKSETTPVDLQGIWFMDGNPLPDEIVSFAGANFQDIGNEWKVDFPVHETSTWTWHDSLDGKLSYFGSMGINNIYRSKFGKNYGPDWSSSIQVDSSSQKYNDMMNSYSFTSEYKSQDLQRRVSKGGVSYDLKRIIDAKGNPTKYFNDYYDHVKKDLLTYNFFRSWGNPLYSVYTGQLFIPEKIVEKALIPTCESDLNREEDGSYVLTVLEKTAEQLPSTCARLIDQAIPTIGK